MAGAAVCGATVLDSQLPPVCTCGLVPAAGVHGVTHGEEMAGVVGVPCPVAEPGPVARELGVREPGAVGAGVQGLATVGDRDVVAGPCEGVWTAGGAKLADHGFATAGCVVAASEGVVSIVAGAGPKLPGVTHMDVQGLPAAGGAVGDEVAVASGLEAGMKPPGWAALGAHGLETTGCAEPTGV